MSSSNKRLKILRLVDTICESGAPYNQFSLPWTSREDISICTIFKPQLAVSETIKVFEGDGSLRGFFHALKMALDCGPYDIVHVHTPHTGILLLAAKLFMWGKINLAQTIFTVHGSFSQHKVKHKLMLIPIIFFFHAIVCCGHSSFSSIPRLYRWLAGDRLYDIPNGANIDHIDSIIEKLPNKPIEEQHFIVVVVGRLIKRKDPITILDAFGKLTDQASQLIFIGDGSLRAASMAQSSQMGVAGRVGITGHIPRDKVFAHLADADVFVSAAWDEGLPVAVVEAMASRCPVILSDIPPHREIADGADFIPLVKPGDVAGFAKAIERFRQMTQSERAIIGEKCRKIAVDRYSVSTMHNSYEKLYRQLINKA